MLKKIIWDAKVEIRNDVHHWYAENQQEIHTITMLDQLSVTLGLLNKETRGFLY